MYGGGGGGGGCYRGSVTPDGSQIRLRADGAHVCGEPRPLCLFYSLRKL